MRWLLFLPVVLFAMSNATMLGFLSDPWAPWRLQAADVRHVDVSGPPQSVVPSDPAPIPGAAHGGVTDAYRYQLARAVGWSPAEAIIATAISIAEDGSGDPTALSAPNFDGSRDFCLLQVNSGWWARFGGQQALANPLTCFRAGFAIFGLQGWCAWSTYDSSCGRGHTGTYRLFLSRAMTAAHTDDPGMTIASTAQVFSQSLRSATRGYLTDYPGAPDRLVLWIDKGLAGVSLQRNCTLASGVRSGVNVMAGYPSDDPTQEGETIWLSAVGAVALLDEPPCEASLDQWIDSRPCAKVEGVCDVAALTQP